jgi:hypothetical protein
MSTPHGKPRIILSLPTEEELKKRIFSRVITFTPVYLSEEGIKSSSR